MSGDRKAAADTAERLVGGIFLLGCLAPVFILAWHAGVDLPWLVGLGAGMAIGLLWRPLHRKLVPAAAQAAATRRQPIRLVFGLVSALAPPFLSPAAALLICLYHLRAGIVAILVSLAETFVRMALGIDAGAGGDKTSRGSAR